LIVTINDDFNLYKIAYSGQCFRVYADEDDTYHFITGNHLLRIKQESREPGQDGTAFNVSCSPEEWSLVWENYFDLSTRYSDIRKKIHSDDKFLNNAAEIGKGIRILKQDYFEMLISFIISQRKSIPAIKSSVEKLCRLYGTPLTEYDEKDDTTVRYSFPTPDKLSQATDTELAGCGLGYRVPYIKAAAERVNTGALNLDKLSELSDEALMETLKSLYGVGEKVANCVALFGYHRVGRAPIDTWINKVIDSEYGGNDPFGQYPDTAGIMQQYMFYASQHTKILSHYSQSN